MSNGQAYYSEIRKLDFYVLGPEENYIDSAVSVTNKELFKNDLPVPNGCYDANLGTTDYSWNCALCQSKKGICPGHSGSLDLRYPVKSPLFRDNILKWLKIICFKCGRPIIMRDLTIANSKVLSEYVKLVKGVDRCQWCGELHPTVEKDRFKSSVFYIEYKTAKGFKREELFNHHIRDIFGRVSDETVLAMGKPLKSHPRNFILDIIRVPPNTIRPDIR